MNKDTCPKCNANRIPNETECLKCGVIYEKYNTSRTKAFNQAFLEIGESSFARSQPQLVNVIKRFPELAPTCNKYIKAINAALSKYQNRDYDHAEKIFYKLLERQPNLSRAVTSYRVKIKKKKALAEIFQKGARAFNEERYTDSRLILEKLKLKHGSDKDIETYLQKITEIIGPPSTDLPARTKDNNDTVKCPKCGSTSIATTTKSFDAGSACCGAIFLGPLGLLCGSTSENSNICQKCGKKWRI